MMMLHDSSLSKITMWSVKKCLIENENKDWDLKLGFVKLFQNLIEVAVKGYEGLKNYWVLYNI